MTNGSADALTIDLSGCARRIVGVTLAVILSCGCRGVAPPTSSSGLVDTRQANVPGVSQGSISQGSISQGGDTNPFPMTVPNATAMHQMVSYNQTPPCSGCPSAGVEAPYYPPNYPCGPSLPCGPSPAPSACPCGQHDGNVESGYGPWRPPGISSPWPEDEYLCDGGDHTPAVKVRSNWSVIGLDIEDTVVHYDTLDGETRVQPSNRVCVYAPRFAAVRRVHGIAQHEIHERIAGVEQPVPVEGLGDVQIATTAVQPVQPSLNRGTAAALGFRDRMPPVELENRLRIIGIHAALATPEGLQVFRLGMMDNAEKARLAQAVEAAAVWSSDQAVQVVIDNIATHEAAGVAAAESLHIYELKGKPRVCVCKTASRKDARPGETIDFTIRFDNVGDQEIGNVTIIDNLTTRLEYVDGSQECSLGSDFMSVENQGDSLTLRWEVKDPIKVSAGGTIRFKCRVR